MICFLTVRKLKPGAYDDFRKAWEPEEWLPGGTKAYHVRNVDDENQVVSFGLQDTSLEDFRRLAAGEKFQELEQKRQAAMAPFVESTGVDGVFEVIDEVTPGS